MYPLIEFMSDDSDQPVAAIVQGRASAIACGRQTDCGGFIDQLLLDHTETGADANTVANPDANEFRSGRMRVRRHVPAHLIGLVSRRPTVLTQLSVRDNLALLEPAGPARPRFWRSVEQALDETGLLAGVDLSYLGGNLPWPLQVEINFLQMWLRHPECLLFDRVYDHEDSDRLLHLPELFRRRYPLRAVCYLQRTALPAGLAVTDVVHL